MQIDPRHLHILSAIVDAGGLTDGALALGKSQPSLSRIVANLEARLGEALFEKGKRPLRPTPLCERLAAEGRTIARAVDQAEALADSYTRGKAGIVRVAGTPIFMDGVISSIIAGFQSENPEVRVDQGYGYPKDLGEALEAGTIDLVMCPLEEHDVPDSCTFQPLLKGRNVVACGPGHPLARKRALKLQDIAEYPWVAQPAGSPLFQDLRDVLTSIGITDFKISYSGGSLSSIVNVLSGSNAIAVLPFSVVYMLPRNTIHALPIRIQHPTRQLGLLTLRGQTPAPAVRRFTKHMLTQFRDLSALIAERQRTAVWRA